MKVSRGLSYNDREPSTKITFDMEAHPTPRGTSDAAPRLWVAYGLWYPKVKRAFRV